MKLRRIFAGVSCAVFTAISASAFSVSASAANAVYYHPAGEVFQGYGQNYLGSRYWTTGVLVWKKNWQQDYWMKERYLRPWTYYSDTWFYNTGGMTYGITTTKERSRSITDTVSMEVGAEGEIISGKFNYGFSTTTTTTYSVSEHMSYNMDEYPRNTYYRIAAMGYIVMADSPVFKEGVWQYSENVWAYDNNLPVAKMLVYR